MPIFFLARRTVINTLDPQLSALVGGQCRAGAVVAATATAVTGWTGGGATTAAVTITKIAGDRTPGIGGKAGAASATISTAGAMMAGPVLHALAPTMAAAAVRRVRRVGASSRRVTTREGSSTRGSSTRDSSTSRAVRRWLRATRVHGATSLHDGTTSHRVGATSRGTTSRHVIATSDVAMSPRGSTMRLRLMGVAMRLSTTLAVARRSAGSPTPRPARHRCGVWARHPRKSPGVRRQRPRTLMSWGTRGVC